MSKYDEIVRAGNFVSVGTVDGENWQGEILDVYCHPNLAYLAMRIDNQGKPFQEVIINMEQIVVVRLLKEKK